MKLTKIEVRKCEENPNYILEFKTETKRKKGLALILARQKWDLSIGGSKVILKHTVTGFNAVYTLGSWSSLIDTIKTAILGKKSDDEAEDGEE